MAVMQRGRVIQIGTPRALYLRPRSRFVANFLGETNLLSGHVKAASGETIQVETQLGVMEGTSSAGTLTPGAPAFCSVHPESITLGIGKGPNRFRARVERELFLGEVRHLYLKVGEIAITCYRLQIHADRPLIGAEVELTIDTEDVVVLPAGEIED